MPCKPYKVNVCLFKIPCHNVLFLKGILNKVHFTLYVCLFKIPCHSVLFLKGILNKVQSLKFLGDADDEEGSQVQDEEPGENSVHEEDVGQEEVVVTAGGDGKTDGQPKAKSK